MARGGRVGRAAARRRDGPGPAAAQTEPEAMRARGPVGASIGGGGGAQRPAHGVDVEATSAQRKGRRRVAAAAGPSVGGRGSECRRDGEATARGPAETAR